MLGNKLHWDFKQNTTIFIQGNVCEHYSDVIMGARASQITSLTIVYSTVNTGADQKNIKAQRHWPLCGEFTGDQWISRITDEFPTQMSSNMENISIWWCHHEIAIAKLCHKVIWCLQFLWLTSVEAYMIYGCGPRTIVNVRCMRCCSHDFLHSHSCQKLLRDCESEWLASARHCHFNGHFTSAKT